MKTEQMPAGCELDALLAEKVMGIPWDGGNPIPGHDGNWSWPPPYSTEIAAAWLVVEKLRGDGMKFEVETVDDPDGPNDQWRAVFYSAVPYGSNYAPTPMLAICRAALLAVKGGAA